MSTGEYVGAPLRSAPLSNLTPPLTSAVATNSLIRAPTHRAAIHDLLNRPSSSRAALVVHWVSKRILHSVGREATSTSRVTDPTGAQ